MNNIPYISNIDPNKSEERIDCGTTLCEIICDKNGKPLLLLSAESNEINTESIFKMFEQFPMHQV